MAADHDDASTDVSERLVAEERGQRVGDGTGILGFDPKNDDAGVRPGRIATNVTEAPIESDHEPVFSHCGGEHVRISGTAERLVDNGIDVVAQRDCRVSGVVGKIFVELEPH